jgi:hypothetical protein
MIHRLSIYNPDFEFAAGDYYDESARNNITPCQSLDDYNPYQYQQVYGIVLRNWFVYVSGLP